MHTNSLGVFVLALGLAAVAAGSAAAEEVGCCDACGCSCGCQKICRLECEEKKVEIICWGCKCEDFCLPKPSTPGCKHCELVCDDCEEACDSTAPYAAPKQFVWREWIPGCAKLFTKKKLMQKKETKTIPSYKWVVEDLCSHCESKCECAAVAPGTEIPAPPAIDAKIIFTSTNEPVGRLVR